MNVGYKKSEQQYPLTIELSTDMKRQVLDIAPAASLGAECQDVAATLITTQREICAYAAEDLPPGT